MAWKYVQYNGETGKRRTVEGGSGGASSFSELEDVSFSNLENGQVPKYNSDTQKWENADESGGTVTDVQVNGTSVVNQQGEAEITSYKEVTMSEYNALPQSKETDGVLYCIKDAGGADAFPPLIFSDEEREIGVWRDGKPLYQKTYIFNSLSVASNTWVDTGISIGDIDAFIDAFVIDTNTSHKQRFACLGVGTVGGGSGNIGIYCNFNNSPRTMSSLTIRYTKTTDTAGSGTWTTQGEYAHHYNASEKVIGAWIDGKPLYEKVFQGTLTNPSTNTLIDLVDITSLNVDTVCNISGTAHAYSSSFNRWLSMGINLTYQYNVSSKYICLVQSYSSQCTFDYKVILQYTKTTD